MNKYEKTLYSAYNSIKDKVVFVPEIALVLGSGLGDFANELTDTIEIPYSEINGFPVSTVQGHEGKFVIGRASGINLIVMKGRVHYYEGYSMDEVVMPIRLMKLLGAKTLILTNAAGGINKAFEAGDFMVIKDQITSFVPSPLIGPNIVSLGTRFPDMTNVYDLDYIKLMKDAADESKIDIKEGVYLQTTGPNYETPAEISMFRTLGADAVGMSTTCEAMVARHMGMQVTGVSCITNMAAGISSEPLTHKEVGEIANKSSNDFTKLIKAFITKIG